MPSAQVINLNPEQRTESTSLEKTLMAFGKRKRENETDLEETDALKEIYGKYQSDGRNLENALMSIQTRPGISPTTRVNTAKQLMEFQNHNNEMQKKSLQDLNKANEIESNRRQIAGLEQMRGLDPGSGSSFENDPKMFEQVSRPARGTAPLGGLSGTPLSSQEADSIETVLSENRDASAEQLEVAFNRAGIAPGRTGKIIESRRRTEEQNVKTKSEDKKINRKEQLEFHKESQKYDEELNKSTKIAKNQIDTIKIINQSIGSGNVKPNSVANLFKGFGVLGDKISNAYLNGDQAALQASIPALLEGWKEVFGVRLSDADLRILQDKLPGLGNSLEANKAILKVMTKYSKMALLRSKIGLEIKEKNGGLRPLNYANKIEQRYDEMVQPVRIINPKTGREITIPAFELGDALDAGGTLVQET